MMQKLSTPENYIPPILDRASSKRVRSPITNIKYLVNEKYKHYVSYPKWHFNNIV